MYNSCDDTVHWCSTTHPFKEIQLLLVAFYKIKYIGVIAKDNKCMIEC